MPTFTTACPRNCYSTCSMLVDVEDNRIRRIAPHPGNQATPLGVCLKGLSYTERVVSPDRLLVPLRRLPSGNRERISWDAALDLLVHQIDRCRRESGPQSILYYAASGTKGLVNAIGMHFWRRLGGCTTTYGDLCWPAGLEATRLTLGENKHSVPWDLANARLILLWGKNAAETNIHQLPFIHQAMDRGAQLVVIDPRRTETAQRAHLFLPLRPGTDGALALGLAHLLIARDQLDHPFIERHVLGFREFAARVRDFTPARTAAICGLEPAQIEALATLLGTIQPASLCAGFGMQRYTNSGQTMRALIALLGLTGNIGKPGAGWIYANLQTQIFDAHKDPLAFYPPTEPDGVVRVSISTARLGKDMLAQRDPPLRMAWIERGNPATQNPDTNTVLAALRALEFRVVIDQFMTDTAREADLILPAKTLFEQTDVIGAYWHHYIQLKQKVLDPPGEVKPESEIYWRLAERFGLLPDPDLPAPDADEAGIHAYLRRRLAPFPTLTLEQLREGPVLAPGSQEVAFSDLRFATPSGKIELQSTEARTRWNLDELPDYHEPEESAAGARSPYPLYFLTPNTKNRIHSQFGNLRMIRQFDEKPTAALHPIDAAARGIRDGQAITIYNDRGRLSVIARLDHGIRPGCVAVTNGWWQSEGGTVNFCSLGRETDMGHGAAFHDNLVEVAPAGGSR